MYKKTREELPIIVFVLLDIATENLIISPIQVVYLSAQLAIDKAHLAMQEHDAI